MSDIKRLSLVMDLCHLLIKKSVMMYTNIVNNLISDTPPDEVQLCYSRMDFISCTRHAVYDLVCTTKWIE